MNPKHTTLQDLREKVAELTASKDAIQRTIDAVNTTIEAFEADLRKRAEASYRLVYRHNGGRHRRHTQSGAGGKLCIGRRFSAGLKTVD